MKDLIRVLLGVNPISLIHLARFQPIKFVEACKSAFTTAHRPNTGAAIGIPDISLDDILGDRKPVIRLAVTRYEDGMMPMDQAMVVTSILVAESPREVLEIGTYMGYTTRQMAENLETATIHTVDLPEDFSAEHDPEQSIPKDDYHLIAHRIVGREYKARPSASRVRQHLVDTAKWDFREAGKPTFFFIDGSHTYEYCKNDSEKCFELCGGRGVFLWHDCEPKHPGVIRLITEWRQMGRDVRRIAGTPIAYWKNV